MKRFILDLLAALACLALAGCGDDPVIEDGRYSDGKSVRGHSSGPTDDSPPSLSELEPSPNDDRGSETPPEKVPPPLPKLDPPYDEHFKNAVDFKELHLSKRQPGVELDPFMLVFSSGGEGADRFYRGDEQTPFTGWIKDWNENGTLGELTRFANGLEDGISFTWHDNRQLESIAYYAEGSYVDEWIFWDSAGIEIKRETFEDGVRVEK